MKLRRRFVFFGSGGGTALRRRVRQVARVGDRGSVHPAFVAASLPWTHYHCVGAHSTCVLIDYRAGITLRGIGVRKLNLAKFTIGLRGYCRQNHDCTVRWLWRNVLRNDAGNHYMSRNGNRRRWLRRRARRDQGGARNQSRRPDYSHRQRIPAPRHPRKRNSRRLDIDARNARPFL
jgi:hypothetical protein